MATTAVIGDHAVVLGGSMAGLLAARVLSDAYDEVTVVERDALPGVGATAETESRKGVPQGRHIHGLMPRGQLALDDLFPGLAADLAQRGAPVVEQLRRARILLGGHRFVPTDSGLAVVSVSRPFLERCVRERVETLDNVRFIERCDVAGVLGSTRGSRLGGAQVLRRADGSAAEVLEADLIVDALGRGSRMPHWLDGLGLGKPHEQRVASDVGYASAIVRIAPDTLRGDLAIIQGPRPGAPRGGGLAAIEGDRFIVTLMGLLGDYPPTDPDGFMAFARSLEFPDIADALRGCPTVERIAGFRFPASVWRRYDRMRLLPANLVVLGDAVCSFNPIYGQGLTVAALEALALRRHLRQGRVRSRALASDVAKVAAGAWKMSASADLAYPDVPGTRTAATRLANAYIARVQAAAERDEKVAVAFLRVAGMVDPPRRLFTPALVRRVFG